MARISNSVFKGHCYNVECHQWFDDADGRSSAMKARSLIWQLVGRAPVRVCLLFVCVSAPCLLSPCAHAGACVHTHNNTRTHSAHALRTDANTHARAHTPTTTR